MSIYNRCWTNLDTGEPAPNLLLVKGPALGIEIAVTTEYAEAVIKASGTVPSPINGTGLIDTGAAFTAVDSDVLTRLGVPPVGAIKAYGPTGEEEQGIYMCQIKFLGTDIPTIEHSVTGSKLQNFGHIALIGRDILQYSLLVYDGKHGMWTIAF